MNVRLVAYRNSLVASGVLSTTNYSTSTTPITITVSGASATTAFQVGQTLLKGVNEVYGIISAIGGATSITLSSLNIALSTSDELYNFREKTHQLDLQEEPNISLNFQFADIKEPETRKASYSQTFKLPFTDNNNTFFENWFNVNLETLVFSTRQKFNAALYVGTVPQFEGILQLKSVYQKAQVYEVVLMSNSADLFSAIGSKKLKDVFRNEAGNYSDELNHTYKETNLEASWDGAVDGFYNLQSPPVSLRDSVAGVQKVMYPMSVTAPKFWYSPGSSVYLDMTQSDVTANGDDAINTIVPITQFKPAIQMKLLFQKIMARAGFSYTSAFLDGNYFGKLFMTTCNHTGMPSPMTEPTAGAIDGEVMVGSSVQWGFRSWNAAQSMNCDNDKVTNDAPPNNVISEAEFLFVNMDTVISDSNSLFDATTQTIKKTDSVMTSLDVSFTMDRSNIMPCWPSNAGGDTPIKIHWELRTYEESLFPNNAFVQEYNTVNTIAMVSSGYGYHSVNFPIDISNVPVGRLMRVYVKPVHFKEYNGSTAASLILGGATCNEGITTVYPQTCNSDNFLYGGLYCLVKMQWTGFNTNVYDRPIDVPNGIDPEITQKSFLKDIIERFNLVILSDPDNASNLLIEPYNDFMGSGELKHWTDKIDLDKEIIVKDTTSLQKQRVLLTDLEDVDVMNKSIKQEQPNYNVYGKIDSLNTQNQFASGEMKNNPIFSPYINQKVFVDNNEDTPTALNNFAAQYEYTYKATANGFEDVLEATKPKLFYYSGTPSNITNATGGAIYMHSVAATGAITSHSFGDYPLCSPFDLTPNAFGIATIEATTKSLYWNQNPPVCGNLTSFNYAVNINGIQLTNSLYFQYWEQYFNSIYNENARIMECHLNLNEVDIFNFSFADEIYIKDTYWRVLNISNYQVGAKASTKVTLIKSQVVFETNCNGCSQVVGEVNGNNIQSGSYVWCPATTPGCTPDLSLANQLIGYQTTAECCECAGGDFIAISNESTDYSTWPDGTGICSSNSGSLPIQLMDIYAIRSTFTSSSLKSIISGKLSGLNKPIVTGTYTDKFQNNILPYYGNDIVVKYNTNSNRIPKFDGEDHRIILAGYTVGNTRGYAYSQGDVTQKKITIPSDSNMAIQIKGIATVIGGTSSTYPVGITEAFSYHTAFKSEGVVVTQIGTAGGVLSWSIKEVSTTCTLYISSGDGGVLKFGLDDSQTDTKRIWQLTVDLSVNRIVNMERGYGTDYALYQNGEYIQLQNLEDLIWN